jgi:hypothetical protein
MGEKHGRSILLIKHIFHACKVLLHAANLRHGTDGFTSPPKEGVLRILSPFKGLLCNMHLIIILPTMHISSKRSLP